MRRSPTGRQACPVRAGGKQAHGTTVVPRLPLQKVIGRSEQRLYDIAAVARLRIAPRSSLTTREAAPMMPKEVL